MAFTINMKEKWGAKCLICFAADPFDFREVSFTGHIPQVTSTVDCVADILTYWTVSPGILGDVLA